MHYDVLSITLIDRFNGNKKEAFKEVYSLYHKAIYRYAITIIKNEHEAEDITAEVFIKLLKTNEHFKELTNIKTWLYVVTRNACFDYFKSSYRKVVLSDNVPVEPKNESPTYYDEINAELIQRISQAAEHLSKSRRAVIHTILRHGYDDKQVAKHLNVEEKTARNTKNTAINLLRGKLVFKPSTSL